MSLRCTADRSRSALAGIEDYKKTARRKVYPGPRAHPNTVLPPSHCLYSVHCNENFSLPPRGSRASWQNVRTADIREPPDGGDQTSIDDHAPAHESERVAFAESFACAQSLSPVNSEDQKGLESDPENANARPLESNDSRCCYWEKKQCYVMRVNIGT